MSLNRKLRNAKFKKKRNGDGRDVKANGSKMQNVEEICVGGGRGGERRF
jgi:hypothetical protein